MALLIGATAFAQTPFAKGDKKIDLTIGVGSIPYADKNRATFDQHLSMEWGIAEIADKFTIGVGFAINNQYGGQYNGMVVGTYDYAYHYRVRGGYTDMMTGKYEKLNEDKEIIRQGFGTAEAKIARDDIDAMATCSFHYSPMDKLDVYVKAGLGIGVMNYITSNIKNEVGFEKVDYNERVQTNYADYTTQYSYNDLDHVKWSGMHAKLVPSVAAFVGGTYYLDDNWGVDAQIGLIDANIKSGKKGYPNSYGVFAVGVSYKF